MTDMQPGLRPDAHNVPGLIPHDPDLHRRPARLRELGLSLDPDPEWDDVARQMADTFADTSSTEPLPFAFVNLFTGQGQFFPGLFVPPGNEEVHQALQTPDGRRSMPRDFGYCPHLARRGDKALPLADVRANARFNTNPVVDRIGILAYLGVGLIDPHTNMVLGSVCVVARETRPAWRTGGDLIKEVRDHVMRRILERRPGT